MNATPPTWMKDPTVLGNWLATRTKFAKNTAERLNQVSRVDAICWFLTLVDCLASSKDIKAFATAFRGDGGHVGCCSLLNSCYGGVGNDFSGELPGRWRSGNYGRIAPLYRPFKHNYSPTAGGLQRSARVQSLLNAAAV